MSWRERGDLAVGTAPGAGPDFASPEAGDSPRDRPRIERRRSTTAWLTGLSVEGCVDRLLGGLSTRLRAPER